MSVSIPGFTFYRPSESISIDFTKDSDGNNIGRRDSVSVTDIVTLEDSKNLASIYSSAVNAASSGRKQTISYAGITGQGTVKSISLDSSSDFVTKLSYTVTAEVIPDIEINSIYGNLLKNKNVVSLSASNTLDVPYDLAATTLPIGGTYYNKTITATSSAQAECHGPKGLADAREIVAKLIAQQGGPPNGYTILREDTTQSSSAEGKASKEITRFMVPSEGKELLASEEKSASSAKVNNYEEQTYKITLTDMNGDSGKALSVTEALLAFIISQKSISVGLSTPGEDKSCATPFPPLDSSGCWTVKNASIETNQGNGSSTLVVDLTTQNVGDCDRNGYKTEYNVSKVDKAKVYAEVAGWCSPGYIVQNFNTNKQEYYEYNIDITSLKNCADGATMVDMAKSYFNKIDVLGGTGKIVNHTINVAGNKCSLRITQYPPP